MPLKADMLTWLLTIAILGVTPRMAFAPVDVRVTVETSARPETWVTVLLENETYSRRTDFLVERGRTVYWCEWRAVPAGDYVLIAADETGIARTSVQYFPGAT